MSKESFKLFVKKHPDLVNYIRNNEMTWQKFYEIYDLYGENNEVWNKYFENRLSNLSLGDTSLKEIFNMVKKVDLNSVKKGVEGLQKVVGLAQDIASVKSGNTNLNSYQSRPIYKYFED